MGVSLEPDNETVRRERAITWLSDRADAPIEVVRDPFAGEFARLNAGAKVRKYIHVLTTSSASGMLLRRNRLRVGDPAGTISQRSLTIVRQG